MSPKNLDFPQGARAREDTLVQNTRFFERALGGASLVGVICLLLALIHFVPALAHLFLPSVDMRVVSLAVDMKQSFRPDRVSSTGPIRKVESYQAGYDLTCTLNLEYSFQGEVYQREYAETRFEASQESSSFGLSGLSRPFNELKLDQCETPMGGVIQGHLLPALPSLTQTGREAWNNLFNGMHFLLLSLVSYFALKISKERLQDKARRAAELKAVPALREELANPALPPVLLALLEKQMEEVPTIEERSMVKSLIAGLIAFLVLHALSACAYLFVLQIERAQLSLALPWMDLMIFILVGGIWMLVAHLSRRGDLVPARYIELKGIKALARALLARERFGLYLRSFKEGQHLRIDSPSRSVKRGVTYVSEPVWAMDEYVSLIQAQILERHRAGLEIVFDLQNSRSEIQSLVVQPVVAPDSFWLELLEIVARQASVIVIHIEDWVKPDSSFFTELRLLSTLPGSPTLCLYLRANLILPPLLIEELKKLPISQAFCYSVMTTKEQGRLAFQPLTIRTMS